MSLHAAADFPRKAFTVDDVRRMVDIGVLGENERVELIEGDLIVVPPKVLGHELIKTELSTALVRVLPDHLFLGVATTIEFADDVLVDADIVVLPRAAFRPGSSGFAAPVSRSIRLLVEIACSSLDYDCNIKGRLYARHGVQEFWVIDANTRVTWVHAGPQGDGWSSVVELDASAALTTTTLPGFSIKLADIG